MSKYRNRSNRSVPILDKQDELFDEEMTKRIIGHRGECDEQIL